MCHISTGCFVLPVSAGGERAAEVRVASLSVSFPTVTPWGEGGVQRGEATEGKRRRR